MAKAAAGKTNWFAIWVSVAVVVVVALVVALVVWMNNAATDPGTPPSGSGINQETGAVVVGRIGQLCGVGHRSTLPMREVRRALLGERRHTLGLVVGGERRVEQPALVQQAFGQHALEGAVDGFLRHP